jgi:RimJ/RimL family protein N-acetyltransferase
MAGVQLLVAEAFSSGQVDMVLAETSLSNAASKRVLEKAGFSIAGTGENEEGPVNLWVIKK